VSSLRRFWRHTWAKVLAIAVAALLVLGVAVAASASYSERSSFCVTACHEMQPFGATWKASSHSRVACVRCHIKSGAVELVKAKVSALREVYVHFAGQVKAPIAVTEHIPNGTCVSCHPASRIPAKIALVTASSPALGGAPAASPSP
jgi:nitrate/TMAO reductase-like tetraheme cytochrome c subunit